VAYDHPMATETAPNYDHSYEIVTLSEDGEVLLRDSDFAEDARFIWLDQTVDFSEPGEKIQLIEKTDGTIIEEKVRGPRYTV